MALFKSEDNTSTTKPKAQEEFWVNIGVHIADSEGKTEFIRLPLGIPISALKVEKIYGKVDSDYKKSVITRNQVIEAIKASVIKLKPGESKDTNALSAQLYRRQEIVETSTSTQDNAFLDLI